jgi:cold shock CspA family protein
MLWFNEKKDLGFILTDEGERVPVAGADFVDGNRPQGRCAHAVVTFEIDQRGDERQAENVVLVEESMPRRARRRVRAR